MIAFEDEVYVCGGTRDGHDLLRGTLLKEGKEGVYNQSSPDDVRRELWTCKLRQSPQKSKERRAHEFVELLDKDVLLADAKKGETQ